MIAANADPMGNLASAVADLVMDTGMAFIEDDKVAALEAVLREFFVREKMSVDGAHGAAYFRNVEAYDQRVLGESLRGGSDSGS
jgi:hypothetical protein